MNGQENEIMGLNEIIAMGHEARLCDKEGCDDNSIIITDHMTRFAKLVADVIRCQERDHWKGIVDGQLRCITVLNDIVGGEGSTTTKNILDYSRMEERIKQAILEERERIAQMIEDTPALVEFAQNDKGGCLLCGFTPKIAARSIRELE